MILVVKPYSLSCLHSPYVEYDCPLSLASGTVFSLSSLLDCPLEYYCFHHSAVPNLADLKENTFCNFRWFYQISPWFAFNDSSYKKKNTVAITYIVCQLYYSFQSRFYLFRNSYSIKIESSDYRFLSNSRLENQIDSIFLLIIKCTNANQKYQKKL